MVIAKIENTTQHGAIKGKTQTTLTNFYNLDAIIAVGYRVNSKKATKFKEKDFVYNKEHADYAVNFI